MYSASNNFKTECKRDVNSYKRVAKIHVVEDNIDITNANALVSFTIEELAHSKDTFVGNTVAKKISLDIINDGSYNLEDKEIQVYSGIDYVGDGSNIEYIPHGSFIIAKPTNKEVKNQSNYVGYDYMLKAEVPYVETNIVYPISLYNYLSAICTSIGIQLGNQSIPNGSYQVLGNAYTNGETFRQVIEEIAKCCGGYAVIGRDNKLYIRTLTIINNNQNETITPSNYFDDFELADAYGPVNRVAMAVTYNVIGEDTIREDAESIVQNGLTEIRVADISFLNTEAQRELVVGAFWSTLHNLTYIPFSAKYYGFPYLDTGDIIKVQRTNNSYFYTYVLNYKFTYNGSFEGSIEAPALSDVEEEHKQTSSARDAIKNTELRVNKIDGEIAGIVEEIGDRSQKTTSITEDIDRIELKITDIEDLTLEVNGLNPIELTNCLEGELVALEIKGNNTVFAGLVPSNTLTPSNSLVPRGDSLVYIKHYEVDEQTHQEVETIDVFDLGLTEGLRQHSATVYDSVTYNFEEGETGKWKLTRRVGVTSGGQTYELAQPVVTPLDLPDALLTKGRNVIDLGLPYTTNCYARYVQINDFTKLFATTYEVESAITQLSNSITLLVREKVNKQEVIAELNLEVQQGVGTVTITGNRVIIQSDNFELTADGVITAKAGTIGGLTLEKVTQDGSYLYKDFEVGGDNFQSGLFIPDNDASLDKSFIYAGLDKYEFETSDDLEKANLVIKHNGEMICKRIKMYVEDGYSNIYYDNENLAMSLRLDGIYRYLSNNNYWAKLGTLYNNNTEQGEGISINDALYFGVFDDLHDTDIARFYRIGNQGQSAEIQFYARGYINGAEIQTAQSDARMKDNIEDSETNALEIIEQLRFRQFDWNKQKSGNEGHVDVGFIAQEVQQIDEQMVIHSVTRDSEQYGIDLLNTLAITAKAVQELSQKVKDLEDEIKKLKGEN